MGLKAESQNAKKGIKQPSLLNSLLVLKKFYFLLLANTNAPPDKKTADRIRYKVPNEVPVFGNSSSAAAGVPCATGVGDGSFSFLASLSAACSDLAARGVANVRDEDASAFVSAVTTLSSTAFVKTAVVAGVSLGANVSATVVRTSASGVGVGCSVVVSTSALLLRTRLLGASVVVSVEVVEASVTVVAVVVVGASVVVVVVVGASVTTGAEVVTTGASVTTGAEVVTTGASVTTGTEVVTTGASVTTGAEVVTTGASVTTGAEVVTTGASVVATVVVGASVVVVVVVGATVVVVVVVGATVVVVGASVVTGLAFGCHTRT